MKGTYKVCRAAVKSKKKAETSEKIEIESTALCSQLAMHPSIAVNQHEVAFINASRILKSSWK